ncbi:MAG: hypothetical protein A2176_08700 [Spirochaetes bacterium RBG_13_51_14]|nr:MAG: hypothetical protein A2176_08700 [Spirochaetes bacterium RBG_13_51_14]
MARIIMLITAAMAILESCYSFQEFPVERKYVLAGPGRGGQRGNESMRGADASGGERAAVARFTVRRYFARMRSGTPVAVINNMAVDLSVQERFGEAEILFREVLAEDPGAAAGYNNLGVICEIIGKRDEAFRMYLAACRIEPDNRYFRKNFVTFADCRRGSSAVDQK